MPRIDPLKLLNCLSGLLAPNGGIRSSNDVKRLTGLMAKFSKKLVSKCIYIQILKCTETDLLGQFMTVGGWALVHMWLTDGIQSTNWPLVQEILELLLLCPVDVQRLKSNTAPKMVKHLSKDGGIEDVRILATKLVEQWLKIVKSESVVGCTSAAIAVADTAHALPAAAAAAQPPSALGGADNKDIVNTVSFTSLPETTSDQHLTPTNPSFHSTIDSSMFVESLATEEVHSSSQADQHHHAQDIVPLDAAEQQHTTSQSDESNSSATKAKGLVYKITLKDGKQVLAKVDGSPAAALHKPLVKRKMSADTASVGDAKQKRHSDDAGDSESSGSRPSGEVDSVHAAAGDNKLGGDERLASSKDSGPNKEKTKSSRDRERERDKERSKEHKSSSSSSRPSSSSSSSRPRSSGSKSHSSSSRSSRDDKDRHRSSSTKSSSSSSRDKSRDKSVKSESTTVAQANKDKETLTMVMPPSIGKLGKIPKKQHSDADKSDAGAAVASSPTTKKPSISIEVRKDFENRPKTVKTFNSKFRSHGLAEEAPPPPSRKGLKKPLSTQSAPGTTIPPSNPHAIKRHSTSPPPDASEKKAKLDVAAASMHVDKPGSIKLISPKPKPSLLLESDMFMDALSAATTTKKDALTRKRKRRPSLSKDATAPSKSDAPADKQQPDDQDADEAAPPMADEGGADASAAATTTVVPKDEVTTTAPPMKFYTDTLSEDAGKTPKDGESGDEANSTDDDDDKPLRRLVDQSMDESSEATTGGGAADKPSSPAAAGAAASSDDDETTGPLVKPPGPGCGPNGPPGVLIVHRRKGPKKQLRWRPADQLEEVRFFELDENERINVTKTFVDMKQMERSNEREGFIMARKLNGEDNMTEQIPWSALRFVVEDVPPHPDGANSKERDAQRVRELSCLQALYFNRIMIPDNPAEPDFEVPPPMQEPQVIPLDDVTGNPDAVNDFTSLLWPESRGTAPNAVGSVNNMDVGGNNMGAFNGPPHHHDGGGFAMHGQPFGFGPKPGAGMQNWNPNGNVVPPPMMDGPPPGFNMMNGGGPPPDMMMGPMGPRPMGGPRGPMPPMTGPPMNNMNNNGGMPPFGPPGGPNNFNSRPPFNNFNDRPGNNNAPWFRQNGPPPPGNWRGGHNNNNNGNRPPWLNRSRICKSFSKGFCRHGENCNFLHPGQNCPLF